MSKAVPTCVSVCEHTHSLLFPASTHFPAPLCKTTEDTWATPLRKVPHISLGKELFPNVAFWSSLGLQTSTKLMTGQQVVALNWSHTRDPLRILFARCLFLYVASYGYLWQRAPSVSLEAEQTGALPIKSVTKT